MDIKAINERVIRQFRVGGEVDGMHRDRLLLLGTVGARTGLPRTTPMMFHRDGDRVLVIASNMGAPAHPGWYHNLLAHPAVHVEVDDDAYDAVAEPVTGAERERLWELLTTAYPFFAEHAAQAGRTIPVIALTRV